MFIRGQQYLPGWLTEEKEKGISNIGCCLKLESLKGGTGKRWKIHEAEHGGAQELSQHFRAYCKAYINEWEAATFSMMLLDLYMNGGLLCVQPSLPPLLRLYF